MNNPRVAYNIFHCNLAFSSIEEEAHINVIEKCYWPLLKLAKKYPIAIELTAYTLERIFDLDSEWVETYAQLIKSGDCELVGSGDTQIIGPLAPERINYWNQKLGIECYQKLLNVTPKVAYINEQSVSSSLLDTYIDAGYEAVFIEWDNLYSHNANWSKTLFNAPQCLLAASGRSIKVLWNWSVGFQKLQRLCHGQLHIDSYLQFIQNAIANGLSAVPVYGNDAEVFDYRPGRFKEESLVASGEWDTLENVFEKVTQFAKWQLPSEVVLSHNTNQTLSAFNAMLPVAVKKQQKYNLTRWCLSGRNDLLLNTLCFSMYKQLKNDDADKQEWQSLCRLWASDYRTHLTEKKYNKIEPLLCDFHQQLITDEKCSPKFGPSSENLPYIDQHRHDVIVNYGGITLVINIKRGGAIKSLSFNGTPAIIGTIEHGDLDHIALAADFYSNHFVAELITERRRITDLNKANVTYHLLNDELIVQCKVPIGEDVLIKSYRLTSCGQLFCGFKFNNHVRPLGSIRLGYLTLLNHCESVHYACHNGNNVLEPFELEQPLHQGQAVSALISSLGCLGATEGEFHFGNEKQRIKISWDPSRCAAIPMIQRQVYQEEQLNRMWFSLVELDETLKENGILPNFEFCVEPIC